MKVDTLTSNGHYSIILNQAEIDIMLDGLKMYSKTTINELIEDCLTDLIDDLR